MDHLRALSNLTVPNLTKMLEPGVLGVYRSFEVTEVFGFSKTVAPTNILTIIVAEDDEVGCDKTSSYLTENLIKVSSLKGWSFGVKRYRKTVPGLLADLLSMQSEGRWKASGQSLAIGNLKEKPAELAPSDSMHKVVINNLLKNNFWNGSYFFEWADATKDHLAELFTHPRSIQELSAALSLVWPINLAKVSDRIGNILVQLPITAMVAEFRGSANREVMKLDLAWAQDVEARPLRLVLNRKHDNLEAAYHSQIISSEPVVIPTTDGPGEYYGYIWDELNNVLMASTGAFSQVENIDLQIQLNEHNRRSYQYTVGADSFACDIPIVALHSSRVGNGVDPNDEWTSNRMYTEEIQRLKEQRRFLQYKPIPGREESERQKALEDIRWLINKHGQEAVWLWDPFLDMYDVFETLFYSKYSYADLRAISSAKEKPACACTPHVPDPFVEKQKKILASANCNNFGLKFEFRARVNSSGWKFHDRFLIFPRTGRGALAWSLGTSINSVGKQHHILQRVDDGQLIMDAFLELWASLDRAEQLICKI